MTNIIIASFQTEAQAILASEKLSELELLGDITIYERVIVRKDLDGDAVVLQTDSTAGMRTVSGMAIGTLIGAIAGPVGMMIGMFSGTLSGAVLEADYFSFSEDFGAKAIEQLQPGKVAIIAEIDEDIELFVDAPLVALGATLVRTNVDYEYDKYSDEQIEDIDEEIAEERANIKSAVEAQKAKIQNRISSLKEKRRKRIEELKQKAKDTVEEIEAPFNKWKVNRLKKRIENHQVKLTELQQELEQIEHTH